MKHSTIVAALQILAPEAQYTVLDEEIIWECDQEQPSIEDIERVGAAYEIKMKRLQNYPSIGDQLDSLYHAGVFPESMADQIKTVKESFPISKEWNPEVSE